jgi:feruloyl esterase
MSAFALTLRPDVFGGYQPGGENKYFSAGLVGNVTLGIAINYMQYMVYNTTAQNITYANSTYADVLAADRIDPGQQNAMNPDLRPFVERKGKLIHYVGWADHLIAPTNSVRCVFSTRRMMSR